MRKVLAIAVVVLFLTAGQAMASLTEFIQYTANGAGLSIDAKGFEGSSTIRAEIPTGASVYKAFLYSADVFGGGLSNVSFEGNTLISDGSSRLDVGGRDANGASENRWDVTSAVQSKVGSGSGLFSFDLSEFGYLDGEILAVLYNDSTKPLNTAFIFDGESATTGDSTTIFLAKPVDKTDPDFQAIMSLGISYGYQPSGQYSIVDINGVRLTTSAGGQDDGYAGNGGLITAGGIGDSVLNPLDPFATDGGGPRYDDELYTLNDYIQNGDTSILIRTLNPSQDDNLFFMGFTTLGEAATTPIPQGPVPEPASMSLLGAGLFGLIGSRRRKQLV